VFSRQIGKEKTALFNAVKKEAVGLKTQDGNFVMFF